ncbi:hypothetical protein NQ015_03545 [Corynebacterium sp. 153RC1]|uniref:hypothetical protein n=1 Tax=unclassified Corynebacterium TaxID=2624378 RepID=UPI00211CDA5D|nr:MULTISPECIES: hypothetical protein [unclassified Corynebacterium]MCQ9370379.1 hypothetical protein [Corynebacterium sp. 35RC1]MCQ9351945.1 hypothetical protein [Corynebacterium sp. 209RC1]MCQ9353694.1 hypothetical protein [Corynebacterium sp. 1222RC1]MCQ9356322.1 hypothetical protein [Corynebacterium sp. 122RC1]MCQ9358424.1 hypothetical protein [Corynebacterium sp. 142RC1]
MIVLIDGPSGAGKTTFAGQLGAVLSWPVVHLDDFYPGWGGLAAARDMVVRDVLGRRGFWRWDWEQNVRGEWVDLDYEHLIIEGVGAISSESLDAGETFAVVLTAPEQVRRERALARDPYYKPYWEMWACQEKEHFAQLPWERVHVIRG